MRVLVVEDEGLVAMTLEDMLNDLGCEVAFSGAAVAETLVWLDAGGSADAALLDVNLGGEYAFAIADAHADRGTPFAFSTGYGEAPDARFSHTPLLAKPVRRERLVEVLRGFGLEA